MKKITLIAAAVLVYAGSIFAQTNSCFTRTDFNVGYSDDTWNRQIITADFNGDSKADLATIDYNNNTVSVLLGDGAGNFADNPFITFSTGSCPKGLVSADFNGDSKADIAVTDECNNNVSVYLGNGSGGFGAPVAFAAGSGAWGITAGDFNADGKQDLAVTNNNDGDISVLIGNGNGTFLPAMNYNVDSSPRAIATSDLNGDGKADLVVSNYNGNDVAVLLGNGNGTFASANYYNTGSNPQTVIVADFNADGKKDLAVTCWNDDIVAYLPGNGDGSFQNYIGVYAGNNPVSVTAGDFNSDGNLDMATANVVNDEVSVVTGDGNGNFSSPSSFNVVSNPLSLVSADFNGDGKADIALANREDQATILLNTNLPNISASTTATSVCPGGSVILTATGAGTSYTNTYDIRYSDLVGIGTNCGWTTMGYNTNVGFNWNSLEPAGANIVSVKIEANMGVDWSGGTHNGYLNYNYSGGQGNGYHDSWCWSGSANSNIFTYNANPNNYSVNSSNYFYMSPTGGWFGFYPVAGWGNGNDVYARVTVTYGASYSWTNGAENGVPVTPPVGTTDYVVTGTTETGCANTATVTITVNPAIIIPGFTVNNVTCNPANCDGTADLSAPVSGGAAPYTYSWSNGASTSAITGLCAGDYTLTVTDAEGCSEMASLSISNTSTVSLTSNSTNSNCICSGTADVTIAPGAEPYTYAWSNGASTSAITGLCAGSYTFTGTDVNGCEATLVENIINDPNYTLSVVKTNAACTGSVSCSGTATATPVSGAQPLDPPYTYAWAPAGGTNAVATGLCAGNYTVTATDNSGCTQMATISIGVTPVTLSFVNITANCSTSCTGKSTVSVAGGTAPYTYTWSNGGTNAMATGLCGGSTYTVTVVDASGCSNVSTTTIGSNPLVAITNFSNTSVSCTEVCNGSSTANVSGGVGPYTYAWSTGATTATATGLCYSTGTTSYTLTVTDANGCSTIGTTTIGSMDNYPSVDYWSWTDASCDAVCNGIIVAQGYNGSGTYSYSWSNGATVAAATGLCAGTSYTVVVTDAAGCTNSDDWTMDSDPMDVYISANNASCNVSCNGDAYIGYLNLNNNTEPLTYLWSNGATTSAATGLCAGTTISVSITSAEGCVATSNENIYADNSLEADIHGWWERATCKQSCDAVAISDVWGNEGPVTYLWSTGATTENASNICARQNVSLTVTDSLGCTWSETQLMGPDYDDGVKIDYLDNTDVMCAGGICDGTATVFLDSDDYAPITYTWSNGGTGFITTGLCAGDYTLTVTDTLGCRDSMVVTIDTYSDISFSTNSTNASCTNVCNGTASVTNLSGGVPSYNYSWMPGGQTTATATGLCAGTTYSVTVTDVNGCTTMNTEYINQNAPMTASANYADASCAGVCNGIDSVFSVSNENGPVTYMWMPSGGTSKVATGLCAGSYTVVVTDSVGCSVKVSNTIGMGNSPWISVNSTPTLCNSVCNGTAFATAGSGTSPYSFSWSNGATTAALANLCAGGYAVTVTDANGCTDNAFETVYASATTMSVTATSTAASCNGICDGVATAATAGGTGPFAYAWTPSGGSLAIADSLCGGLYTVVSTDANGCTQSAVVTVTKPAALLANVTVTNSTSCVEGNGTATANVVGGTAPYFFVWTPTGQLTQTAVTLANGTYSVVVTDASGCTATSSGTVTCTSGVNDIALENSISVYPNPTSGNVMVEFTNGNIQSIEINNMIGQTVNKTVNEGQQSSNSINLSAQPDGIYFIRVTTENGIATKKLVIAK